MANSGLNANIIHSRHVLFVGAGASEPLGLRPTRPFLELLPERLALLIVRDLRVGIEEGRAATYFNPFFDQAAQHFKVALPDSEVVLDYIDDLAKACRELNSSPPVFRQLAGTIGNSGFHTQWAEMLSKVRSCIQEVMVVHYSRVDRKLAWRIYKPLLQLLCAEGQTLPLCTTNYDWAFECLAEESAEYLKLEDGFERKPLGECWSRQVFDDFHPDPQRINLALFKLHGSTSWYRNAEPPHLIQKFPIPAPELAGSRAMLIYPTQIKTEAVQEEPFKTAYEYLQETLMNASLGIIIGFSFRDTAVNDTMRYALANNSNLKLAVVEPKMNEDSGVVLSELLDKLGIGQQEWKRRMRVIKGKFGDDAFVYQEVASSVQKLDQWDNLKPWVERSQVHPVTES